ncbi:MATE family efflux transporter [Roseomonas terrae]|jgi:MATE family multidrug resistance protein|uniref:MATE family efflux transporter n=1 Tax=Neoroseomonas terrae TaxID=424799 RepID=A0ABS5EH09_9PROT|nr:MATE family efflux transporter [Neoroseomonas terrae]MBR0650288.1 MATE family efflux transporter [Neoroseomonas terrae]
MDAGTTTTARPGPAVEARATLALAGPIVLTNLSQMALVLTESMLLGRLGTEALAAGVLGSSLFFALLAPGFGLALAAAPLQAQCRGASRLPGGAGRGWVRDMRKGTRAALWASALAILATWPVMWNAAPVLRALGQDPTLALLAQDYARGAMFAMPSFCAFVVLRGFLAAMERPAAAMWVSLAAVALNLPVAWALIFPAGFGVQGAGLAVAIVDAAMLAALLLVIHRDRVFRRFRLLGRVWLPRLAPLKEVALVGLPIAGSMLLEIGVFSAAAFAMGWFGAVAAAAHAIAIQTASATFMVPLGVGQAVTARVGLATGAGDLPGARRAGWVGIGLGAAFMATMAVLLIVAAPGIAGLFLDPTLPRAVEATALAATLLVVAGLFQLGDGIQVVAAGALRGRKDTRVPMLLAALGYWGIGLPSGLALAHLAGWGPVGVWLGLFIGTGIVALLMLGRWRRMAAA